MDQKKEILTEALRIARKWMNSRGWKPQAFQVDAWQAMLGGKEGLINAPTGSGKTYSLLLPFLAQYAAQQQNRQGLQLVWITPVRALAKEIKLSADKVIADLQLPLTTAIRTGDTTQAERQLQTRITPNIIITTPESLHLMLGRRGSAHFFSNLKMIVADEWHELLSTKRGVQVELACSRIKSMSPGLQIWGISATIGNLPEAMEVLLGKERAAYGIIVKADGRKKIEVTTLMPSKVETMPWSGHLGVRLLKPLLPVIHKSSSTILFTNTRAQCEVWYRKLLEADESLAGQLSMHHGSISKELRAWVEDALYEGKMKAVVSTSSLDLGVDFSPVETVVQIGGPKGVARFIQRAGRSGHRPGAVSHIFFLPVNALELLEASALRQAIAEDYLESREPLTLCFDVLIQYLVTLSLGDGFAPEIIFNEIKNTYCYQHITQEEWNWILQFTAYGGASLSGYDEYKRITLTEGLYKVSNQRIARRHRMAIGTIVGDTMMAVRLVRGGLLGHVEESFIASLNVGDNFWFAGMALELIRTKELTAYVKKSDKLTGRSPSWQGGRLSLTSRMSDMLRKKMNEMNAMLNEKPNAHLRNHDPEIMKIFPLMLLQNDRSHVPAGNEFLIEQITSDEGHHLLFYPFEGRLMHEGMAALFAYRIGKMMPISFSLAYNDYGFELLSDQPLEIHEPLIEVLTDVENLERDLLQGVNAAELAIRKFRDIAAISGLVFKGYPGQPVRDKHLQSSSSLIFRVFEDYDPHNLLLRQAFDEVVNHQLEMPRLRNTLTQISQMKKVITRPELPTPFAFPIMVDRLRERMSTEDLAARIEKMNIDFS